MKEKVNPKIIPILFLAILTVFMVLPMSSTATAPADVTITMALVQGPYDGPSPWVVTGTNTGTWSASGAFTDEGTVVENYVVHFLPIGGIIAVTTELILTGEDGSTIIIRDYEDGMYATSPTTVESWGHWEIVSGTGLYENAVGQGTSHCVVDIEAAQKGEVSNFYTLEGSVNL